MQIHLSGDNQATACGQNASFGVPEATWKEAAKVTCKRCRKTKLFAKITGGSQ